MENKEVHPLRRERLRKGWTQQTLADFAQVSVTSIERAERGESLRVDIGRRICEALDKEEPEELGLHCFAGAKVSRRQVAKIGAAALGAALFYPSYNPLEDTDVLDRLVRTLKRPSSVDETMLVHLESMGRNQWQLYAGFENSIEYRYDMLHGVSGHLQTIIRLLEHPQPQHTYNRLSYLACETTQLIGEIYFDLKNNDAAERYYNTAIKVARETHDDVMLAVALGRKSFISIYSSDARRALPLLHEASTKLTHYSSDIIRAWLSAREAEAYANMHDADAHFVDDCFKALERAELYLERAHPGEAPSYAFADEAVEAHFSHALLLGYKGACYTRLKQTSAAQAVLKEEIASMNPARSIHNAIVLVDLARTYVQQGEIEEACTCAEDALLIMVQLKSARVLQRMLDLRRELEPWDNTEYVKNLDKQIATLPYFIE